MDEVELRTAAAELLIIELVASVEPHQVEQAEAAIRDGLAGAIAEDERTIRLRALELIAEGKDRWVLFRGGTRA